MKKVVILFAAALSHAINSSNTTKDHGKPFVYNEGDKKPHAIGLTYDNAGNGNRNNISHHIIHSNNHVAKFEVQARSLEMDYVIVGGRDKRWQGFAHKVTSIIAYFRDNMGGGGYLTNDTFVVLFDARDCVFQHPWHVVVDTLTNLYHQQVTNTHTQPPYSLRPVMYTQPCHLDHYHLTHTLIKLLHDIIIIIIIPLPLSYPSL